MKLHHPTHTTTMKLHHLLTACAAILALCPLLVTAQTTAVPNFISYQGRVVDSAGANVGAGTPVNRTVIFRIWDSPSSTAIANLIYSESQTVTVSDGEFSVLVGQGVKNTTLSYTYSEDAKFLTDLGTAFNGSARYLGVTVASAATIATTDNEITPRQQIVSTAFAMRAKFAESIGSSTDLVLTPLSGTASNYGLGWYGTGRLFGTTAVDGPVLYGNAGGALGSKTSPTATNTALQWDASGRVGIGATSITSTTNKLTLQGDMTTSPADQLTVRGNADNNKRLLLGYDTTNNKASLQSYTGVSTTGSLLLNPGGGNVGVNNTAPSVALDVTGAVKASTSMAANGTNGHTFAGTGDADGGLFSPADGQVTLKTNGIERVRVDGSGAVSIPGTLSVTGLVKMGSGTGTAEAPNRSLITRRVNTSTTTLGTVVATSSGLQVVRDGTSGGMRVRAVSGSNNNVFYKIYNQTGGLLRSVNYAQNSQTGDFIQICTDAERISRIEISFGDSLYAGEWTDLTLNRFISAINGNYENWVGFMTSTVNQ